jgi:hypothetical protein
MSTWMPQKFEALANSPIGAWIVSAASFIAGVAKMTEVLQGILGFIAICIAIAASSYTAAVQREKLREIRQRLRTPL